MRTLLQRNFVADATQKRRVSDMLSCSEEGKQAAPKETFVFTRAYTNKNKSREATTDAKRQVFMSKRKENERKRIKTEVAKRQVIMRKI